MHVSNSLLKPEVEKRVPRRGVVVTALTLCCVLTTGISAMLTLQVFATSNCEDIDARDISPVHVTNVVPVPMTIEVAAPPTSPTPPTPTEETSEDDAKAAKESDLATGQLKFVVPMKQPLLILSAAPSSSEKTATSITVHRSDDFEHVLSVPVEIGKQPKATQSLIGKRVALFSQAGRCEATIKGLVDAHWFFEDSGPKTSKEAKESFEPSFLAATLDLSKSCGSEFVGGVILEEGHRGQSVKRFAVTTLEESNPLHKAALKRAKKTERSKKLQAEFAEDGGTGDWSAQSYAQVVAIGGANPTRLIVSFLSDGCGAFEGINVVEYEVNNGVLGQERVLSSERNLSSVGLAVDSNGDGAPDILATDHWSSSAQVLVSDGSGNYVSTASGSSEFYMCRC